MLIELYEGKKTYLQEGDIVVLTPVKKDFVLVAMIAKNQNNLALIFLQEGTFENITRMEWHDHANLIETEEDLYIVKRKICHENYELREI